jgi:hypothetical protein
MQSSGASETRHCAAGRSSQARATHDWLARTNGTTINRLARDWRGAAGRHSWTRRLRRLARSRTGLLQPRDHIGTRWNDRTRRRLPRKIGPWLRPQRRAWSSGRSRGRHAWRRGNASCGTCRHRHCRWRHGWGNAWGSRCRQRLSRSGQNLARARWRRRRPCGYWSGTQRRMHRCTSAGR